MRHGSLFSGIGGFDLAAEWMGWENVFQCENNKFCQKVLKQHWPNVKLYDSIENEDFTKWRGKIDVISGGDPCQPSSVAGKRKGRNDDRFLWPQYKRVVSEVRPSFVVNENVRGTVSNGILDEKISDLEALGYAWWPPLIIPASAVGADHKRERIWLIAYSASNRLERDMPETCVQAVHDLPPEALVAWNVPGNKFSEWKKLMASPGVLGVSDGFPNRTHRIKGLGNAVVPQVVYQIFKAIEQYEANH
jgi:DNA (cytosine-5)-methyltransferase 1